MKTIGLIGGISWQSTLMYYKILNELTVAALGEPHSCKCLIYSLQFAQVKKLQQQNDWESLNVLMADAAQALKNGGADLLLIGANTMHLTVPYIVKNIELPLVHIVDAVGEKIKVAKLNKVALLGTRFTMKKDFYKAHLQQKFGINVIVPAGDDFKLIDEIIYKELVKGNINENSKQQYLAVISGLVEQGAEGIILGCTEIPLLIQQADCEVPVFDTTFLHAEAAVKIALA